MIKQLAIASATFALSAGLTVSQPQQATAAEPQLTPTSEGSVTLDRARGPVRHYNGYRPTNRGRVIGGIAAGVGTAIILNQLARPRYYGPSYYYSAPTYYSGDYSCGQLEARCDSGQEWACRRLDRDPNC